MKIAAALLSLAVTAAASEYTTYIGDGNPYNVKAMAVDAAGNTYLTGGRMINLPGFTARALPDVFVAKLDPAGNILFTVAVSGKAGEEGSAIALDPDGNIYVAGSTLSPDFPLSRALQTGRSYRTGFIMKLSADGRTLVYSTYFGGTSDDSAVTALATDSVGDLYATGYTSAVDFPTTPGMPAGTGSGSAHAFIAKISAAGDRILYSGRLLGTCTSDPCMTFGGVDPSARAEGTAIAVDAAGNAYFGGNTNTTDMPTTVGALAREGVGAFVAKVIAGGAGLAYLTYLGTGPGNTLNAIEVDALGNAYLAGATSDPGLPVTAGAVQTAYAGPSPKTDAFLAKLSSDGSRMLWATYLGGTGDDAAQSIAVDAFGNVWAVGTTASPEFPNPNGSGAGGDFLVGLDTTGSTLRFAARFPNGTVSQSVARGATAGLKHLAGRTGVVLAIDTDGSAGTKVFGMTNAAAGAIGGLLTWSEVISIYGSKIGPATPAWGAPDSSGLMPESLAGVQVSIGGRNARLLYVSESQINAVVPLTDGPPALQVTNAGTTSPEFRVQFQRSAPQIFRNTNGFAAAINQDGSPNSMDNPAPRGSVVSVWATGTEYPPLPEGQIATSASYSCYFCQMTAYGAIRQLPFGDLYEYMQPLDVLYAGAAPGMVAGITQINFRIPYDIQSALIVASVSGSANVSEPVQIYIAP